MRWPWQRRPPSTEAQAAKAYADRALADTDALLEHIDEVAARAHEVADRSDAVRARNHLAEAITASMRRGQAGRA